MCDGTVLQFGLCCTSRMSDRIKLELAFLCFTQAIRSNEFAYLELCLFPPNACNLRHNVRGNEHNSPLTPLPLQPQGTIPEEVHPEGLP